VIKLEYIVSLKEGIILYIYIYSDQWIRKDKEYKNFNCIPCGAFEYLMAMPPKCAAPIAAPPNANFLDSLKAFNWKHIYSKCHTRSAISEQHEMKRFSTTLWFWMDQYQFWQS
jgi:hypothetical protein